MVALPSPDLPLALTGLDHQDAGQHDAALDWLINTPAHQRQRATVPDLRDRFNLTASQACAVIAAFNLAMARAA